jgi:hypothetical protein
MNRVVGQEGVGGLRFTLGDKCEQNDEREGVCMV